MIASLKSGLLYTALGVYSRYLVQLIVVTILSRLLTPKMFGVVAIMQIFNVFFIMMIESGMGPAIIQEKSLSNQDNNILFNFSAFFSLIISILFGLLGLFLSFLYTNSVYITLTWVQAVSVLFNGLNIVPTALLNKRKKFAAVNFSIVIATVISGIVGVVSAFWGLGVYALVFSNIILSFINFFINFFISKVKFLLQLKILPLKKIWNFSKNQFLTNIFNYFSLNSDNILIGKFMGATPLANYNKAYQLLMLPNQLFSNLVTPVLQPILSEKQDNVDFIRVFYFRLIHLLALVGIPLSVYLNVSARSIIFTFFGYQWGEAILPFEILSLTVWVQMILTTDGAIFQSRNKTQIMKKMVGISSVILVLTILIGIILGSIIYVSICLSCGFVFVFFIRFHSLVKKVLHGTMQAFLKEFISPVILGGVAFILLEIVKDISIGNVFSKLIFQSIIFILLMCGYIFIGPERKNIKFIFGDNFLKKLERKK